MARKKKRKTGQTVLPKGYMQVETEDGKVLQVHQDVYANRKTPKTNAELHAAYHDRDYGKPKALRNAAAMIRGSLSKGQSASEIIAPKQSDNAMVRFAEDMRNRTRTPRKAPAGTTQPGPASRLMTSIGPGGDKDVRYGAGDQDVASITADRILQTGRMVPARTQEQSEAALAMSPGYHSAGEASARTLGGGVKPVGRMVAPEKPPVRPVELARSGGKSAAAWLTDEQHEQYRKEAMAAGRSGLDEVNSRYAELGRQQEPDDHTKRVMQSGDLVRRRTALTKRLEAAANTLERDRMRKELQTVGAELNRLADADRTPRGAAELVQDRPDGPMATADVDRIKTEIRRANTGKMTRTEMEDIYRRAVSTGMRLDGMDQLADNLATGRYTVPKPDKVNDKKPPITDSQLRNEAEYRIMGDWNDASKSGYPSYRGHVQGRLDMGQDPDEALVEVLGERYEMYREWASRLGVPQDRIDQEFEAAILKMGNVEDARAWQAHRQKRMRAESAKAKAGPDAVTADTAPSRTDAASLVTGSKAGTAGAGPAGEAAWRPAGHVDASVSALGRKLYDISTSLKGQDAKYVTDLVEKIRSGAIATSADMVSLLSQPGTEKLFPRQVLEMIADAAERNGWD